MAEQTELLERSGPWFGVCVRTIGRLDDLKRALASVAAQTMAAGMFEVIVVQDGDGNDLSSLIEDFRSRLSLRLIQHTVSRGKGAAANAAANATRAPWLCLLDEDDAWYPHHLETLAKAIMENPIPRVIYTDTHLVRLVRNGQRLVVGTHGWEFDPAELATMFNAPISCSVAISREAWLQVGGFDAYFRRVLDDWDFYQRLARTVPFQHVAEVTACYTVSQGNKSWRNRAAFLGALEAQIERDGTVVSWQLRSSVARRIAARRIDLEATVGQLEYLLGEARRAAGCRAQDAPVPGIVAELGWAEAPPDTMQSGCVRPMQLAVRNRTDVVWGSWGGRHPIGLSYHWFDPQGGTVVWDGLRTPLPRDLGPGDRVTLGVLVEAPLRPGLYHLQVDLVQEGVCWASQASQLSRALRAQVLVRP